MLSLLNDLDLNRKELINRQIGQNFSLVSLILKLNLQIGLESG